MSRKPSVITLLTDFGSADYFVGAMKGVILGIFPSAQIVDITHEVPPQDIEAGAFTLLSSYRSFPAGTIHVAVVDPGVGSSRRAIAVRAAEQLFVGPDNGLFSYVLDTESTYEAVHVTAEKFFKNPVSQTFHGRDVFAPVGAALANGVELSQFGPHVTDIVRLESLAPVPKGRKLKGQIIHIDHFGNCVTNFRHEHVSSQQSSVYIKIKGKRIEEFRSHYAEGDRRPKKKLFAIWGSAGFLELSAQNASAAELLKAEKGTEVRLEVES